MTGSVPFLKELSHCHKLGNIYFNVTHMIRSVSVKVAVQICRYSNADYIKYALLRVKIRVQKNAA